MLAWLGPLTQRARPGGLGRVAGVALAPEVCRTVRPLSVAVREPGSLAERSALALLHRDGAVPFGVLVRCVARDLYVDELRHGGWVVDLGVLGPTLFAPEAAREIEAADGALWEIG